MQIEYTWTIEDKYTKGLYYKLVIKDFGRCATTYCKSTGVLVQVKVYSLDPEGSRRYNYEDTWWCISCIAIIFHNDTQVLEKIKGYLSEHPELCLEMD